VCKVHSPRDTEPVPQVMRRGGEGEGREKGTSFSKEGLATAGPKWQGTGRARDFLRFLNKKIAGSIMAVHNTEKRPNDVGPKENGKMGPVSR